MKIALWLQHKQLDRGIWWQFGCHLFVIDPLDWQIRITLIHKMLPILNINLERSKLGKSRRVRSNSTNPVRNRAKTRNKKRDSSASTQRSVGKDYGLENRVQKQGNKVLAAMVPIIRKSITPVAKFFSKHLNIGMLDQECDICYAPAWGKYFGVFLCHSCKQFFDHHSFKHDRVMLSPFSIDLYIILCFLTLSTDAVNMSR